MSLINYIIQRNMLMIDFDVPSLDLIHISELKGSIDSMFNDVKDNSVMKIYIDMSAVKYIDSSGIGLLISIKKRSKMDVYLKNINPAVKEVIKLASLQFMFIIE